MKAAVLKAPRVLKIEEIPKPVADDEFLVLEVKACGICGSDVRYYEGENPWALHTLGKFVPNPPNIVLGHEFAGVVHEVSNPEYARLLGKRVSVLAFDTCGVCDCCRAGLYHLCHDTRHLGHGAGWGDRAYFPGGMADYCEVWNHHVVELPDSVSFEEATLLDPISVAVHAVTLAELTPGADVLVLGCGAVGLSIAQAVRAFGANRVAVTDIYDLPLKTALENGVTYAVRAAGENLDKLAAKAIPEGFHAVFDTVGTAQSQRQALRLLKLNGVLVNLVANDTECSYALTDLAGERRMICSANNRYEDYLLGLTLIENGTINARAMITHRFPLNQVQRGFDLLLDKEHSAVMKAVLTF